MNGSVWSNLSEVTLHRGARKPATGEGLCRSFRHGFGASRQSFLPNSNINGTYQHLQLAWHTLITLTKSLLVSSIPAFRSRFLAYGSRFTTESCRVSQSPTSTAFLHHSSSKSIGSFLDYFATYRVPHSYFTHFYTVSVLSSVFWCADD
jgi:hypothetical protein